MSAKAASAGSFALAVLCVIGIVVITATGHQVPAVLTDLAFGSAGVFLGVLFPNAGQSPQAAAGVPSVLSRTVPTTVVTEGLLSELVAESKPPAAAHAP